MKPVSEDRNLNPEEFSRISFTCIARQKKDLRLSKEIIFKRKISLFHHLNEKYFSLLPGFIFLFFASFPKHTSCEQPFFSRFRKNICGHCRHFKIREYRHYPARIC